MTSKDETVDEEVDLAALGIDLDPAALIGEVLRSATPNLLRAVKAETGHGLDQLGEMDQEDQLQLLAFVRHRRSNPKLTWEQAGDLSPFFVDETS